MAQEGGTRSVAEPLPLSVATVACGGGGGESGKRTDMGVLEQAMSRGDTTAAATLDSGGGGQRAHGGHCTVVVAAEAETQQLRGALVGVAGSDERRAEAWETAAMNRFLTVDAAPFLGQDVCGLEGAAACSEGHGSADLAVSTDGEQSDGESSDGEGSEESDGASLSPPSEDDEVPADEKNTVVADVVAMSSLAQVDSGETERQVGESESTENVVASPEPSGTSYPEENLPPKTGISVPMLSIPPTFIRAVPQEPELLYTAPEVLFDDVVRLEADRISRPELVRNITVYDCMEGPPPAAPASPTTASVPALPDADSSIGRPAPASPSGNVPGAAVEELPPYYAPTGPADTTLVFESRFESGNLRRAIQVYEFEYDLVLNPDYNTKSHTQWYFFRVGNTRKGPQYRFNIINMMKPTSVYNEGMRPLKYSYIEAQVHGVGWVRNGENIIYYQNGIRRKDKSSSNYYTLTFTVTFQHDCDMVYFAHCYPYSYTDLQKDLQQLERLPNMCRRFRRRKLCETLAGNACDLITITSFCCEPAAIQARRAVVITARVHPGESNASWVMKGMLDYLTGASLDARILRDNFVFKIIPMLNPDGVIVGNYRCSLVGQDLNRQWGEPSRRHHPTIYFAKNMFRHLLADREVVLYVDIHGHSRKKNVFMYGNSEISSLRERVFPRLLCRSSDCFNFDDCCFKVQKSKESTARVVAYKEFSVLNSFTLEASFCGADFGPLGDQHFTTKHLEEMGYMVCDAILDFCDPDQTKVMVVCKELQVLFPDDGNSDDVSDSDVDDAAALRARRRAARAKKPKKEKAKKKKKTTKPALEAGEVLATTMARYSRAGAAHVAPADADGALPHQRGADVNDAENERGNSHRLEASSRNRSKSSKGVDDIKKKKRKDRPFLARHTSADDAALSGAAPAASSSSGAQAVSTSSRRS
mmetsp:Transcript_108559/g.306027  ORF Transcript_108559/g.306027 Transcript_108559/m.306027 type:complete len:931 (+) Transcript_108559:180-2972(+)